MFVTRKRFDALAKRLADLEQEFDTHARWASCQFGRVHVFREQHTRDLDSTVEKLRADFSGLGRQIKELEGRALLNDSLVAIGTPGARAVGDPFSPATVREAIRYLNGKLGALPDGLAARVEALEKDSKIEGPANTFIATQTGDGPFGTSFSVGPRASLPVKQVVQRLMKACGLEIRSTVAKTEIVAVTPPTVLQYDKSEPQPKKKGARRG